MTVSPNQEKILGSFAVLVGLLLMSVGFLGIYQANMEEQYLRHGAFPHVHQNIKNEAANRAMFRWVGAPENAVPWGF